MARLTLRDKHLLRRMMSVACTHEEARCDSYVEAAERSKQYCRVLAKIVPFGRLAPLKRPL